MRRLLLIGWLMLLPLGGLYHLVAGPHHREMDVIGDSLAEARRLVGEEDWHKAVPKFELALQNLPEELLTESRQLRLELAQAKMNAAKLPEAHGELKELLDELLADKTTDGQLEQQVRESLANSQFYMTWLMRLEGMPASKWEPEIESARQNYKMLAETAEQSGNNVAADKQKENLEISFNEFFQIYQELCKS